MNILWHTWEPGLTGNHSTSGGGGVWTQHLFDAFNKAGHQIEWFTADAPMIGEQWEPAMPIDVAIFCWRWAFPDIEKFETRNIAYKRQIKLIDWCVNHKIPFMVHDQDLKLSEFERTWIEWNNGLIAIPAFFPRKRETMLHYPNPYQYMSIDSCLLEDNDTLIYVGNNYERMEQTVRLLSFPSLSANVAVYGNWMEPGGPERSSPREVKLMLPHVNFMGRLSQTNVIETLHGANATFMLHKPEYGPLGFTTIRWAETAAAGILPIIPDEFRLPKQFEKRFEPVRVISGFDVMQKLNEINYVKRVEIIEALRELVSIYMTADKWLDCIERIAS